MDFWQWVCYQIFVHSIVQLKPVRVHLGNESASVQVWSLHLLFLNHPPKPIPSSWHPLKNQIVSSCFILVSRKPIYRPDVNVTFKFALLRFDFFIVELCIVYPEFLWRCGTPEGTCRAVIEHLPRRSVPRRADSLLATINQYSTSNVMIGSNCPVQSPDKFIGYNEPPGQLFRPQIINSDIFHMMFAEY